MFDFLKNTQRKSYYSLIHLCQCDNYNSLCIRLPLNKNKRQKKDKKLTGSLPFINIHPREPRPDGCLQPAGSVGVLKLIPPEGGKGETRGNREKERVREGVHFTFPFIPFTIFLLPLASRSDLSSSLYFSF